MLTHSALLNLLCRTPKNSGHLHRYLYDCVHDGHNHSDNGGESVISVVGGKSV